MDQAFKAEFLINAMSGSSKTNLIRIYKEELKCTDEDIKELLSQLTFKVPEDQEVD